MNSAKALRSILSVLIEHNACLTAVLLLSWSMSTMGQEILPTNSTRVKILGGLALPTGDFSATVGAGAGYAKAGFGLGAELVTEPTKSFEIGGIGTASFLSMDAAALQDQIRSASGNNGVIVTTGTWILLSGLGSVGFNFEVSPVTRIYGKGRLGFLYGRSPEINATVNGTKYTEYTTGALAVSYGFGFGVTISEKIDIGVHYSTSEPEYEITTQNGGTIFPSSKIKQSSSMIQILVGYVIPLK